jgi:hypothetical protein
LEPTYFYSILLKKNEIFISPSKQTRKHFPFEAFERGEILISPSKQTRKDFRFDIFQRFSAFLFDTFERPSAQPAHFQIHPSPLANYAFPIFPAAVRNGCNLQKTHATPFSNRPQVARSAAPAPRQSPTTTHQSRSTTRPARSHRNYSFASGTRRG